MTRRSWLLLGVLLVVQGVLIWGVFLPSPHSGGDNAGYVALAHSLVSGEGYTEIWDPAAPPHTKYPPVFPVLLALAMTLGATGWAALKTVPVLAALVAVAGVFLWARRRLGEEAGFAVALLTGLTPSLLYHAHWLLSDVPFLAFTALALWRLDGITGGAGAPWAPAGSASGAASRAEEPPGRWLGVLAATVLVALAYFTRSAGLPLVLAGVAALAWGRRWAEAAVLGGGVGIPALLWLLRGRAAGPGEGRYGSEFFLLDP
ncbi:MAG TPA: glycosyltransferase family 39 protein, partial [Longimicrobiales bacterium]|nr:glycosyltransferase family 39 protein [Longimicrobiales bacterium]